MYFSDFAVTIQRYLKCQWETLETVKEKETKSNDGALSEDERTEGDTDNSSMGEEYDELYSLDLPEDEWRPAWAS